MTSLYLVQSYCFFGVPGVPRVPPTRKPQKTGIYFVLRVEHLSIPLVFQVYHPRQKQGRWYTWNTLAHRQVFQFPSQKMAVSRHLIEVVHVEHPEHRILHMFGKDASHGASENPAPVGIHSNDRSI